MILVTGGTGYIGRRIVARLAEAGETVRVAARGVAPPHLPAAVQFVQADVASGQGLAEAVQGADTVIHLVAIIRERGEQRFDRVNRLGTENVVKAAVAAGVKRFIHQSALGAAPDPAFPYLASKWLGEQAVINSGLDYTIFRPSVVFGEGDKFITTLANLVRASLAVVPIVGAGRTRFQPIWVEDLVTCFMAVLKDGAYSRRILEVGGPEHLTYQEIVDTVKRELGARRLYIHLPLWLMRPVVAVMQAVLPRPPVTTAQLAMLAKDNITDLNSVPAQFGFAPRRLAEGIGYIHRQR